MANCAMVYLTGDDENGLNNRAPDLLKRGLLTANPDQFTMSSGEPSGAK